MKNALNHLPERKQGHIATLLHTVHDEFDQVVNAATLDEKTRSRILLVVLFGSYAKGTQVDDRKSGYVSDYDILVVLNEPTLADEYRIWHTVEERATLKTGSPVNLVVCTLREINRELKQGHYFFTDIRQEGIELYNYNHTELLTPAPLNAEEAKVIAQKHFDQWFESANSFMIDFGHCMDRSDFKKAAFEMHQAVERYFSCILLVHTNYRPKTHNIKALYSFATQQADDFKAVFPQDTKLSRRSVELLKKAYIEARYSEQYEITEDELQWLAERVTVLKTLTERLCVDHIQQL
jgi:HEPN domain-containing protein/predicted nucleotidyltransferase